MNEYKTIDSRFKKFANPIKEDYEALAVSLMKNFSITKCEKDSEGIRNVKYRIADLEFYLYSTDDTEDVATLNRDCIEGQWFFHRFGVDIAFRTLRGDNNELIRFGGVLIRGLEMYENGKHVGNNQVAKYVCLTCLMRQMICLNLLKTNLWIISRYSILIG